MAGAARLDAPESAGMDTKPAKPPSIRVGKIELIQRPDGSIMLRFEGKSGAVEVKADSGQLERWAKRQLREGVFA